MNFKIKAVENIRILAISAVVSLGGLYIANAFTGPGVPPDQRNSDQPYSTIAGVTTGSYNFSSVAPVNEYIGNENFIANMINACEAQYGASSRACSVPNADTYTAAYRAKLNALPQAWLQDRNDNYPWIVGNGDGPRLYDWAVITPHIAGSADIHENLFYASLGTPPRSTAYTSYGAVLTYASTPTLNLPILCCYK